MRKLLFVLLLSAAAFGQVSVMPFLNPHQQFLDANGSPIAGGKLYTYRAGTTTPQATYSSSTGTVANTNPIILDAGGYAKEIWVGPNAYKFIAKDANDVLLWTVDNVKSGGGFPGCTSTGEGTFSCGTPSTYSGTIAVATLTANRTYTFPDKDGTPAMLSDIPAVPPGINAGSYATLTLAVAACPNPGTVIIGTAIPLSANLTVPSTCTLRFERGGVVNIATATTATINSAIIAPEDAQVFSLTGTGAVAGLKFVRPEWFGGNVGAAYSALASTGGKIQFRAGTYISPWVSHATEITKPNVELAGVGQPDYNSQTAPTALVGGTILQGPVWVMSDPAGPASGFYVHDLGVDSGSAVVTALFAGTAQEGLFLNNNNYTGSSLGPPFAEGVRVQNITTLLQSPTVAFHSILVENADGAVVENVRTQNGVYGLVVKGRRYKVDGVYSRGHHNFCAYFKSDGTYGESDDTQVANVRCEAQVTNGDTGPVQFEAQATNGITGATLSNIIVKGTTAGIYLVGSGGQINNVTLSGFYVDTVSGVGLYVNGSAGNFTNRVVIANGVINTTGSHGIQIGAYSADTQLSNINVQNVTGDGVNNSGVNTMANFVNVKTATGCAVNAIAGQLSVSAVTNVSTTGGLFCGTFYTNPNMAFPNLIRPVIQGATVGHATCVRSDNSIGSCTTVTASDGSCTCP